MVLHIAFTCFVWISEQAATFGFSHINRLVFFYNRDGECLLRGESIKVLYKNWRVSPLES